ncbi:centrosomal protein 43 [Austrofundulus limnaeus]|uniref:Centrosomal protein 43 n=1 Tax=Austrofundulus limnaeus TaxID=52670 RepID=A0A2I4CZM9_AUSLI|nr:PREDICTED: FGFR1 oncogene partner [Austrofundulus limnaeus]
MSAAEDDTELRDLLIQNLENSGVLNKLKAEMRAAVFLAMEDQDRLENKTPLVNEKLKKCLNTKDGRLVASLIVDFLQVFNLDFSLAVFQPEINLLSGLDSRDQVSRELGLPDLELNKNTPLLLELVRRGWRGDKPNVPSEQGGRTGIILKVGQDSEPSQSQNQVPEDKAGSPAVSKIPRYKGPRTQTGLKEPERGFSPEKDPQRQTCSSSSALRKDLKLDLDLDEEEDHDEGDSFFDDPLPNPQKTYGCQNPALRDEPSSERTRGPKHLVPQREDSPPGPLVPTIRRGKSLSDLSVLAGDPDRDDPGSEPSSELRKLEASGTRGSPVGFLTEDRGPGGGSWSEPSRSRNGGEVLKGPSDRAGSLALDDDVEYDDDFNSHRSDLSNGEPSIGEEIEDVSIEGPENSNKLDETTQDLSVSQLSQNHEADYMEDVP